MAMLVLIPSWSSSACVYRTRLMAFEAVGFEPRSFAAFALRDWTNCCRKVFKLVIADSCLLLGA